MKNFLIKSFLVTTQPILKEVYESYFKVIYNIPTHSFKSERVILIESLVFKD